MERKIAWEKYSQEEMDKVFTFAEDYRLKDFFQKICHRKSRSGVV